MKKTNSPINPSDNNLGFLRLPDVLQRIPVSKATWLRGMESGKYPKPVNLSERCIAWRQSDINALVEKLSQEGGTKDAA